MKWTIGNRVEWPTRTVREGFSSIPYKSVLDWEMFWFEFQRMWYLKSWWSRPSWSVWNSVSLISSNQPENVPSWCFNQPEQQMMQRERRQETLPPSSNINVNIWQNVVTRELCPQKLTIWHLYIWLFFSSLSLKLFVMCCLHYDSCIVVRKTRKIECAYN